MLEKIDLQEKFGSNSLEAWLIAVAIFVVAFVLLKYFKAILYRHLNKLALKTTNDLDDFLVDLVKRTKNLFFLALAAFVASKSLEISANVQENIRSVLIIFLIIQVWFWGDAVIEFIIIKIMGRDEHLSDSDEAIEGTLPAIKFVGRFLLLSLLLVLALDNFGFDVTALLASLGVGGIAVALAVQNVLGDLFASLSIVLDKPFRVGDFIVVGDLMGNVEKIGLKTTRVRSLSGEQLVFSNADLLASRIRNYKQLEERRIVFRFGVIYQTTKQQLAQIPSMIKAIVEESSNARFDRAHFATYGSSSLDFEVVYYVTVPDYAAYMDVQQKINLRIFEKFAEEGIDFAYPTQTLFIEKFTNESRAN